MHQKTQKSINFHEKKLKIEPSLYIRGKLFITYFISAIIQAYSILFHQPTNSFKLCYALARSQSGTWKQSYCQHMIYKRRLRIFSYTSFFTIIIAVVGVTLIFNILFPAQQIKFAQAADFSVTNTNDSGPGSLRKAIIEANSNPGLDNISIDVDGPLILDSPLPAFSDPIFLDCTDAFMIDGNNLSEGNGLTLNTSDSTIISCNVKNFAGNGIYINGDSNNVTDNSIEDNGRNGIVINSGYNNIVQNNQISGQDLAGIYITDSNDSNSINNNTIYNNVGGIRLNNSSSQTISDNSIYNNNGGGIILANNSDSNNISNNSITNNFRDGLYIDSSNSNIISNNYIGTDEVDNDLGNTRGGINISNGSVNNTIGPDNNIAWNYQGVVVNGQTTLYNTITQNKIINNDDVDIKLSAGGNSELVSPEISRANASSISGTSVKDGTIEVFNNNGEYIGSTSSSSGLWSLDIALENDPVLRATLTDNSGNTSYFSADYTADTESPAINNKQVKNITSSSVEIRWTTSEQADSKVQFGKQRGALENEEIDSSFTTSHKISLDNLEADTKYYYQIVSQDLAGNTSFSDVYAFHTLEEADQDEDDEEGEEESNSELDDYLDNIIFYNDQNKKFQPPLVRMKDSTPTMKVTKIDPKFADYLVKLVIQDNNKSVVLTAQSKIKENPKTNKAYWSYTIKDKEALDYGRYKVKVGANDTDDQVIIEPKKRARVDIIPPKAIIAFPKDNQIITQTPLFTFNAINDSTVTISVRDSQDTEVATCSGIINNHQSGVGSGSCKLGYDLVVGKYKVYAYTQIRGAASKLSDSVNFTLIDPNKYNEQTTFPVMCGKGPFSTLKRQPTFTGLAPNNTTVAIVNKRPDGTLIELGRTNPLNHPSGVGTWTYESPIKLDFGENQIIAKTYQNGKEISKTCPLPLIIQQPTPKPVSPDTPDRITTTNNNITISYLGFPGTTLEVLVDGNLYTEKPFTRASQDSGMNIPIPVREDVTLSLGARTDPYIITARARDVGGKKSQADITIIKVNQAVTAPVVDADTEKEVIEVTEPITEEVEEEIELVTEEEQQDSDSDGISDTEEEDLGTNPKDASDKEEAKKKKKEKDFTNKAKEIIKKDKAPNYPLIEDPQVDLTKQEEEKIQEELQEMISQTEISFQIGDQKIEPEINEQGEVSYTWYQYIDIGSSIRQMLDPGRLPKSKNRFVFSGRIPTSDKLKQAGVRGWVILTIASDPVVRIAQADANGQWKILVPAELLPEGEHTAYLQSELNGVQSENVEIARFVVRQEQKFSNTTIFFLVNIIMAILALMGAILMQLRKNKRLMQEIKHQNNERFSN